MLRQPLFKTIHNRYSRIEFYNSYQRQGHGILRHIFVFNVLENSFYLYGADHDFPSKDISKYIRKNIIDGHEDVAFIHSDALFNFRLIRN